MSNRYVLAVLVVLALVAAGCGNGNDGPDGDIVAPLDVSSSVDVNNDRDAVLGDVESRDTNVSDLAGTDQNGGADNNAPADHNGGTDAPGIDSVAGQDTTEPLDSESPDVVDPADLPPPEDTNAGDPDVIITTIPFACASGKTVVEGANKGWTVAGKTREFTVKFPENPGNKPVSIIFVYHGFGDNVANFMKFFNADPNGDAEFPFVLVYPKSLALMPYGADKGIEWSLLVSNDGDNNIDAKLFEEILGCLDDTITTDIASVFVFGFSAGAIFSNLLHSRYPEVIRSVMSMSGAWFNDGDTVKNVNTMGIATLGWDGLDSDGGTVFMTHGGTNDTYGSMGITIIDFEKSAGFAIPFLTEHNRTVIDCPHTSGHTNHPGISTAAIIRYFKEHRTGGLSPWVAGGLPSVYPEGCAIR